MTLRLLLWRARIEVLRYRRTKGMVVVAAFVTALFVAGLFFASGMFAVLRSVAPSFADALLLGAYASIGVFQIVAGFRWGVTRLFLGDDVELLLGAPIGGTTLFGIKLAELVAASPVSIGMLVIATWGYASSAGMALAAPLAILVPVFAATVAALPGMVVALLLARAMSGPRLRTAVSVISPLIPIVWIAAIGPTTTLAMRITDRDFDAARFEALGRSLVRSIHRIPTSWGADIVWGLAHGHVAVSLRALVFLIAAATALLIVGYSVFFATFERSYSGLTEASTRKRRSSLADRIAPPLPSSRRAMVLKEWRTFPRDIRLVQSLAFPLLLFAFLGYNSYRASGSPPYGTIVFVVYLFPNMAAASLLSEKRNLGLLKLAPVRGMDVIVGKLVAYTIPLTVLFTIAVVAIGAARHLPPIALVLAVVFLTWILAGSILGGLGIAAKWGAFDLERPRLGLVPTLLEMAVLSLFAVSQAGVGVWVAARFGVAVGSIGSLVAGIPLVAFAACMATVVFILAGSGALRLETMDAP